jgi:hypothetical protein
MWDASTREFKSATGMNCQDGIPILIGHLPQNTIAENAGVVNQNIYLTELIDSGVNDALDVNGVADIGLDSECIEIRYRTCQDITIEVDSHDVGAGLSKETSEFKPDTACGSGNDHGLFREVKSQVWHGIPCLRLNGCVCECLLALQT